MRRLAISLCIWTATALTLCSTGKPAFAQEPAPQTGGEEPAALPPGEQPAALPPSSGTTAAEVAAARTPTDNVVVQGERWKDILVLPRRPVLKSRRVELVPMYTVSFNNPLIRSHGVGAQLNYFLSEVLWLGLEGQYYFPEQSSGSTGTYFLIGAQDKVLPAVNKLVFSALLDFGYVPTYGKFALFNRTVVHWEAYVTAGVGTFMSQVIPVKLSDPSFNNLSAMVNFGVGTRLFLTKWMALNAYLKAYGHLETFEPVANSAYDRTGSACSMKAAKSEDDYAACRKDGGRTDFPFDVVFGIGLSFFLPPSFEYKLQR